MSCITVVIQPVFNSYVAHVHVGSSNPRLLLGIINADMVGMNALKQVRGIPRVVFSSIFLFLIPSLLRKTSGLLETNKSLCMCMCMQTSVVR